MSVELNVKVGDKVGYGGYGRIVKATAKNEGKLRKLGVWNGVEKVSEEVFKRDGGITVERAQRRMNNIISKIAEGEVRQETPAVEKVVESRKEEKIEIMPIWVDLSPREQIRKLKECVELLMREVSKEPYARGIKSEIEKLLR